MKKTLLILATVLAMTGCVKEEKSAPISNRPASTSQTSAPHETTMEEPSTMTTATDTSGAAPTMTAGTRAAPPPMPRPSMRPTPGPHPGVVDVDKGKDYATVQIYYATDRAFTGNTENASNVFGANRGHLTRGIAHVSIPRLHRIGNLEAPSVLRLEFREDPKKHVVLLQVMPQSQRDFYTKLRQSIAQSQKHEAFIFVHGFDNTFADAAKRTAQIKYDLAYDGAAILFSWPSIGKPEPLAYTGDEAAAEWSTNHFRDFLLELAENSGAQAISVVAHSMGNRILARAFERLPATTKPRFDHVVLTAPDIDVDIFKDLADAIRKPAGHVTLYVSRNDEALKLSKKAHRYPRAGDSSDGVLVLPGMETVDVSNVDTSFTGHSYIAENRTVLSDVFCLMRGAAQAAKRCRLVPHGHYWQFVAQVEDVQSLDRYNCTPPGCPFTAHP